MKAYVDSSVLIRAVFGEPEQLESWPRIEVAVSSELVRVECLRMVDRARFEAKLTDEQQARLRADMLDALGVFSFVPLGAEVLGRAAEPFPTRIGTLDAIHLASALLIADQYEAMIFATHDRRLGIAARAMGFQVEGI